MYTNSEIVPTEQQKKPPGETHAPECVGSKVGSVSAAQYNEINM